MNQQKRIVEGLWDCKYCNTKGISGLKKSCPKCGNPQDSDVKFYLGDKKRYLNDEEAKDYGKGADWICSYCNSYNHYNVKKCRNCGSPRESASKNYFGESLKNESESENYFEESLEEKSKVSDCKNYLEYDTFKKVKENVKEFLANNYQKLLIGVGVALLIFFIIFGIIKFFIPKELVGVIEANSWERTIEIQELKTFDESDWFIPQGARVYRNSVEIYTYQQVVDHYEEVTVEKSRKVFDHYEISYDYSYKDNGDGTFTEIVKENKEPVYRTEYYTEIEKEPVYRSVPIFKTKYYYKIDRWVHNRTEKASGDFNPYWPKYELKELERENGRTEKYVLHILVKDKKKDKEKTYKYSLSQEEWEKYEPKMEVVITVQAGFVTKVKRAE